MKKLIRNLLQYRLVWFLMGTFALPALYLVKVLVAPTAAQAMGFTGFYEENKFVYTFLGDHQYSLQFPGDKDDFHAFAKRMGLTKFRVSDTEYSAADPQGQWQYGVTYHEEDTLRSIRYYSSSQ